MKTTTPLYIVTRNNQVLTKGLPLKIIIERALFMNKPKASFINEGYKLKKVK